MTDNGSGSPPPPGSSASERAKLRMKLFRSEVTANTTEKTSSSNNNDDDDGSVVNFYTSPNTTTATTPRGDDGVKYYNHFTTPFTPSTNTSITNDNMPTTDQQQQQQQQQTTSVFSDLQRSQTVDRFITILTNQLSFALSSGKLTHAWKQQPPSPNAAAATKNENNTTVIDYYGLERNIIMPHITPFVWGGSAILVTLFSLRFGRWYQSYSMMNYSSSLSSSVVVGGRINSNSSSSNNVNGIGNMIRRYIDGSSSSNNSSKYYHPPNQHNMQQSSSTIQDVRQQQVSLLENSMKYNNTAGAGTVGKGEEIFQSIGSLLVDISLSLLFGISTTLFLIDRYQLLQDVVSLPLRILNDDDNDDNEATTIDNSIGSRNVNRSVIVEELCIPFSIEMDKINTSSMIVQRNTPHRRHDDNKDKVDNKEIVEDTTTTTETVSYSELWKDENLNDYITLRSIRDFVTNCHIYDRMKREKSDDESV
jgi:hypothetical protein